MKIVHLRVADSHFMTLPIPAIFHRVAVNAARGILAALVLWLGVPSIAFPAEEAGPDNDTCLGCHSDADLKASDGSSAHVTDSIKKSAHAAILCVKCHQGGKFEDIPHWPSHVSVQCITCHAQEIRKITRSKHAGMLRTRDGKASCATCHTPHAETHLTPDAAVRLCERCHAGAAAMLKNGPHGIIESVPQRTKDAPVAAVGCSSCHDSHAVPDPIRSPDAFTNCVKCHEKTLASFSGSVHEARLERHKMTCASCHSIHLKPGEVAFHCGDCHVKALEEYQQSAHFKQNLTGLGAAANCGDCHDRGHGVRRADDPKAMTYFANQPAMCGKCHGKTPVLTDKYLRLPMTLSNYEKSVHFARLQEWMKDPSKPRGAVCTDCHESHKVRSAGDTAGMTNRMNLADTCGKCHPEPSVDYKTSVHGAGLAHGLTDTPACPDCHESHMIRSKSDPASKTFPVNVSADCGRCHENAALTDRFGVWEGVVRSYKDSYHGWALGRTTIVANCTDCHTTHRIRSHLDPTSSTYKDNVVRTCAKCHQDSNPQFAQSYTHASFGQIWGIHDYVRVVYIVLIILTLGGMLAHNVLIFFFYVHKHYKQHVRQDCVVRMNRVEVLQHLLLLTSFTGLAVTGFALRFPDTWWVAALRWMGMNEPVRAASHRVLAVFLILGTVWHAVWILATRRGRSKLSAYFPKTSDASSAWRNVLYHLGLRKGKPKFGVYDYTQKAEYWALVWGTGIMGLTGFALWFPSIITFWAPGWAVRVSEVIHFYEAILAVGAILVWHFFFVIFHPRIYPGSLTFLTGRMPRHEWKEEHGLAAEKKSTSKKKRTQEAPRED
ncbi:MAG: cytochrome b/b6 domain-containing protein [Pseudomonadota bacterium]